MKITHFERIRLPYQGRGSNTSPAAGGSAGRRLEPACSGGDSVGADASRRHEFFYIGTVALGTSRNRFVAGESQVFKAVFAFFTKIHNGISSNFEKGSSHCNASVRKKE
jgi:hypothetical protein